MCANGDCPRNVLSLTTTWTYYCNSTNDAPHFSIINARTAVLHLSRLVASLFPWTRWPGFVPVSLHLGFMADRWQGDSIFFHHVLQFPRPITIPSLFHIHSSIMRRTDSRPIRTHFQHVISQEQESAFRLYSTARFNTKKFYVLLAQRVYVFCIDLITNSDFYLTQYQFTSFYNIDGACLLRGMKWIFIYNFIYPVLHINTFAGDHYARIFSETASDV
jgi:hypothetical protein